MTIRKKLLAFAVPAVLAAVAVPVAVAHAHALTPGRTGVSATVHGSSSAVAAAAAAARSQALPAARIVNSKATSPAKATDPTETPDETNDPAETGTDTGHTDEVPGSTGESTTDHQFDGQE
jgi:hypothetical protein